MLRWAASLLLVFLLLIPAAQAQCIGGASPPAGAAAAGYTCRTFHWGTGDTLSEIDGGKTLNPGFKFYVDWGGSGYTSSNYSIVSGKLNVQGSGAIPAGVAQGGPEVLTTCARAPNNTYPGTPVVGGQSFTRGWYWEAVMEWNTGGDNNSAGKPGAYGVTAEFTLPSGTQPPISYEADNPDTTSANQAILIWQNPPGSQLAFLHSSQVAPASEAGDKWGWLSTASDVGWYFNDTFLGNAGFSGSYTNTAALLFQQHMCLAIMASNLYPTIIDNFDVWQAPQTFGGARRR